MAIASRIEIDPECRLGSDEAETAGMIFSMVCVRIYV
jgi:hypothetical protein